MTTDILNIFGRRLQQARQMKGWSMNDMGLALKPSLSRQAINKYEKGLTSPDSRMLLAFSTALGLKVDYFFRPYTIEVERVSFRKEPKFPEKKTTAIKMRVRDELERYLEAEQLCGANVQFNLQPREVKSHEDICQYAKYLRELFKLGENGISNIVEVLEDNGIKVLEIPEDHAFKGLSGYANDKIPVIVINQNLSPENKRFTLLHELAHLLLKTDASPKKMEEMCNIFAAEFMLPSSVLIARVGSKRHDISLTELSDIQKQFGISIDEIMRALRRLDVISARRYNGYMEKKKIFPDFKAMAEKSLSVQENSGRFMRMVFHALADETISFAKAAALLNTSIDAVKKQLQLV